jgi:uncharacterized membrane protein
MAAIAYLLLEKALIAVEGQTSTIAKALGLGVKEWASVGLYALGIGGAFLVSPYISVALYVAVAILWFVPDRRFERRL